MSTWRDDASPLAQQDLDRLLNDATVFAQLKVGEDGSFFPFAVVVHDDGVPRPLMIDPGDDEPDATEVVGLLWRALSEMRGDLRATAVCVGVRMPTRKCDGVQVYLEHREGLSITTMMPYSKRRFGRKVTYGEIDAAATEARVWRTEVS